MLHYTSGKCNANVRDVLGFRWYLVPMLPDAHAKTRTQEHLGCWPEFHGDVRSFRIRKGSVEQKMYWSRAMWLSGRNEWHLHFLQLGYPWSAWIAREAGSQLVPSACPFRVSSVNPFSPVPNYLETHLKRAYRAFTCHSRCVTMPLSSMIQYLQDFVNLA